MYIFTQKKKERNEKNKKQKDKSELWMKKKLYVLKYELWGMESRIEIGFEL